MNDLSAYFTLPRARELAPSLYDNRKKALLGLVGAIVAGYVLGVPTSFYKRRGSLPWEPSHMLIAGTIWAVVLATFAIVVLVLMQRYVTLFERGAIAEGVVIASTPGLGGQSWIRGQDEGGAYVTLLAGEALAVGTPVAVIHQPGSRLLLLTAAVGTVRRASKWPAANVPPHVAQVAGPIV